MKIINYGDSFINTYAPRNNVQFSIDSCCTITFLKTNIVKKFYHCSYMKAEYSYGRNKLFQEYSYDFTIVIGEKLFLYLRIGSYKNKTDKFKRVMETLPAGGTEYKLLLKKNKARQIDEYKTIKKVIESGKRIISQTTINDKEGIIKAVIEYPVKCFNHRGEGRIWQVDTGPIIFPFLSKIKDESEDQILNSMELAHVCYCSRKSDHLSSAEFMIGGPARIGMKYKGNYSKIIKQSSVSKLFTANNRDGEIK